MIIGAYYKNGYGRLKGPMVINNDKNYPFRADSVETTETYTSEGFFNLGSLRSDSDLDLSQPLKADGSPWVEQEKLDYTKVPTVEEQKKISAELNERIRTKQLKIALGSQTMDAKIGHDTALKHQEGGSHYKNFAIQPLEYITKNDLGFCEGAIVKYVTRYKLKNGIEDLKKARHILDYLIEVTK